MFKWREASLLCYCSEVIYIYFFLINIKSRLSPTGVVWDYTFLHGRIIQQSKMDLCNPLLASTGMWRNCAVCVLFVTTSPPFWCENRFVLLVAFSGVTVGSQLVNIKVITVYFYPLVLIILLILGLVFVDEWMKCFLWIITKYFKYYNFFLILSRNFFW